MEIQLELGRYTIYQSNKEEGLKYLNDSLEILEEIESDDRYSVQECINRLSEDIPCQCFLNEAAQYDN